MQDFLLTAGILGLFPNILPMKAGALGLALQARTF